MPMGVRKRYEILRSENQTASPDISPDIGPEISQEDSHASFLTCDTEKSFLRGITRFHHDGINVGFLSAANREGTAWELEDGDSKRIGDVTARIEAGGALKSGWQVTTPAGRTFDIYDQKNVGQDILRSALGSWPDAYACVEGTNEVGAIRREERSRGAHGGQGAHGGPGAHGGNGKGRLGRPSFLGRLNKMMVTHDWVFAHTASITPEEELLLISGMLAIIEVTVPGHCPD